MRLLLVTISIAAAFREKTSKKDLSNGFRTEIDWVEWDNAVGVAKDLNKPIFFLIHKTWCGACRGLKQEFNTSSKMPDFIKLSKKFVMVNVEDDDEPEDEKYAPDGGYIPRILFLDTNAEPLKTNNEAKYKNNKYFYPLVPQVIDGMERALKEFEANEEDKRKNGEKSKKAREDDGAEDGEYDNEDEDEEDEVEEEDSYKQESNDQETESNMMMDDENTEAGAKLESKKKSEKGVEKHGDKVDKGGKKGGEGNRKIKDEKSEGSEQEDNKEDAIKNSYGNREKKQVKKEHQKQEL